MNELINKTLIVFHSYKTSFAVWQKAGILSRELALYRKLKLKFKKIYFVSYATDAKSESALTNHEFEILVNAKKSRPFWYALTAWHVHREIFKQADFFRINQTTGFFMAGPAKLRFWGPKLVVRFGFLWTQFQHHHNLFKKFFAALIEFFALRLANRVIVTSQVDCRYIKRRYFSSDKKIIIIRNLVDTEIFKPSHGPRDKNKICAVGRLEPQKNYPVIIEALKNSAYELIIFGQGYQQEEIFTLAKAKNVKVDFRGVVSNNQLGVELDKCYAYLSATLYEGSPKATLEAMAVGLPVIVSDIAHNKEIVNSGVNGLVVSIEPLALRAGLGKITSDQNLAQRLGENAREWILKNASLESVLGQELSLYSNLI